MAGGLGRSPSVRVAVSATEAATMAFQRFSEIGGDAGVEQALHVGLALAVRRGVTRVHRESQRPPNSLA
jgi:hypothetical protein